MSEILENAASAAAGLPDRLNEFLQAGGPVVLILLACSVVALAIVLLKLWQFQALRARDRLAAQRAVTLLRAGRPAEALSLLAGRRDPVVGVLARAIRGRQRRDLPEATVREEVLRSGNEVIELLRSHLGALEVIGGVAPLLGLFGTVLGMIGAFRRLAEAGDRVNPAVLSGGIWEALLTTAVGLAVAIPVVVLCNWFERRVERVAHEMENLVTQVFTQDLSPASEGHHDSAGLRLAAAD
ncbi:MotA/TolQ/ExbB proton channel family protein [Pelagibius marinus]|uniref:MotA/TolQ/ExbB proton channel family protein n=1 Tax=Pelagibius marinus TaxID=2762760 RepID=UPI0018724C56|nr:MotA/TolQ/ExbB proton channel family protein [Pelagibius marinus]